MDETFPVAPGVRRLTVNLDQDDEPLFEQRWSIPHGVALHCYLIEGTRRVIVDPWDSGGFGPEEVGVDLSSHGLGWRDIAAVAFTRPPTPESLVRLRTYAPGVEVWGTPEPGVSYDLGSGLTLEDRGGLWFVPGPGVLLSGDAFSGLGWVEDEVWTEDLGEHPARHFEDEALRWFAGCPLVPELPAGALVVAPAHGCLWKRPEAALARALRFQEWGRGPALDEVTVVWPAGSDHDAAVEALVGGVLDADAGLNLFRFPGDDAMAVAAGARRASLVVVAEGLDPGFLDGLDKELWRPEPSTAPGTLRTEVARRYGEL